MKISYLNRIFIYFLSIFIFISCESAPVTRPPSAASTENPVNQQAANALAEEIRSLTETGILSSMLQAIEIIRSRDLGNTEFGRLMSGICSTLIRLIYPDSPARLPVIDLPQTSNYTRIIREAQNGNYIRPQTDSSDFLEHVLPFLTVFNQTEDNINIIVLRDLEKAAVLKPNSVLPPYFSALFHEHASN